MSSRRILGTRENDAKIGIQIFGNNRTPINPYSAFNTVIDKQGYIGWYDGNISSEFKQNLLQSLPKSRLQELASDLELRVDRRYGAKKLAEVVLNSGRWATQDMLALIFQWNHSIELLDKLHPNLDLTNFDPRIRHFIILGRNKDVSSLLLVRFSLLNSIYIAIEPFIYGDFIHRCDIRIRSGSVEESTITNIENIYVRSSKPKPSKDEVVAAMYFTGVNYDIVPSQLISFLITETLRVSQEMNWKERAHFGSMISYKSRSKRPTMNLGPMMCAYEIVKEDLGLEVQEISELIQRSPEQGVRACDLKLLYNSQKKTLYTFDLGNNPIKEGTGIIPREERLHNEGVFVLLLANQHVYRPNEETRKMLLKRTPEKIYIEESKVDNSCKSSEIENDIILVDYFEDAMKIAEEKQETYSFSTKDSIEDSYKDRLEALDRKIEEQRTKDRRKEENKGKLMELKSTKKSLIESRKKDVKDGIQIYKKARRTNIYIKYPSLTSGFMNLLSKGFVYDSDINHKGEVSNIKFSGKINLYANEDFKELSNTASKLDIHYINQTLQTLSRLAFKKFKKSKEIMDDDGKITNEQDLWKYAVMSNTLCDLLASYPAGHLNLTNKITVEDGFEVAAVDFYRNYASIAREGDFYTIPLHQSIEDYDHKDISETDHAIYYVETNNSTVFSGNGVYDFLVVKYGLEKMIISKDDIKKKIGAVHQPSINSILKDFVDRIYSLQINDKHKKYLINHLIGGFQSEHTFGGHTSVITDNLEEASFFYHTSDKCQKIVRTLPAPIPVTDDAGNVIKRVTPYLFAGNNVSMKKKTNELIRRAIAQRARMRVCQLADDIRDHYEYPIIEIKTDAVYYLRPLNFPLYPVSDRCTFGSIRKEEVKKPCKSYEAHNPATNKEIYQFSSIQWNEPLGLISDSKYFDASKLLQFKRAYIEGFAGTGKTYILLELAKLYRAQGKKVELAAFTHAAADLIDGRTTHSFAGIDMMGNSCEKAIKKAMSEIDVLLIDELSMVPDCIYSILSQLPKDMTIIGAGDFRQFEPIEKEKHGKYVDTDMFKELFGNNLITLRKICRSDRQFAMDCVQLHDRALVEGVNKALSHFDIETKEFDGGDIPAFDLGDKNICYRNKTRRAINKAVSAKKSTIYKSIDVKKSEEFSHLIQGMPLISNTNSNKWGYHNNQRFTLISLGEDDDQAFGDFRESPIRIESDKDHTQMDIPFDRFIKDFRPAYAITAHKAQGSTIRDNYGIHEAWMMGAHGIYVALTRATDKKNITIHVKKYRPKVCELSRSTEYEAFSD